MSAPAKRREHGTRAKYVVEKCRCTKCRAANNASQRQYQRRKAKQAFGQHEFYVDAEPVRQHVRALMDGGVGWHRIARLSGVPSGSVSRLLYGDSQGRPPSRGLRPETARKLLAVTIDQAADGARIDGTGTRRRLQALVAIGWSGSELMRRMGRIPTNFGFLVEGGQVKAHTARAVRELYEQLWNTAPPETSREEKISASRSRRHASDRGWPPPMAWDDDTIDRPDVAHGPDQDEQPDHVAVERVLAGHRAKLRHVDRVELARRVLESGGGASRVSTLLRYSGTQARTLVDEAARTTSALQEVAT